MKNLILSVMILGIILSTGCKKDSTSERFKMLTGTVWTTESLLANGIDASGPGQLLEKFKGDAEFREDGTGYFGLYTGTWYFAFQETEIVIQTDSLPIPLTALIDQLTASLLKITTSVTTAQNPSVPVNIEMTFKAK
jgi:hypothetical protein